MNRQRGKKKSINKHSKEVYNQQITGAKFKKLENQFLAINKSKIKIKML